ncbi:MAG: hypothetical protein ABI607_09895 [Betaproteobacteria bacterium]
MSHDDQSLLLRRSARGGRARPFGKHKGYGLAVMCELLEGALAGEWTAQPGNQCGGIIVSVGP